MITVWSFPAQNQFKSVEHVLRGSRFRLFRWFCAVLVGLAANPGLNAQAQRLVRDGQSMSGVTDVTGGARTFLEDDDVVMLQIKQDGRTVTTSVVSFDTSDSKLSHDPHTSVISRFETKGNFDPKKGIIASHAVARNALGIQSLLFLS